MTSNIEHVLFSTIKSAQFFDIGRYGDCLSVGDEYLFCSLLYDVYFRSLDAE